MTQVGILHILLIDGHRGISHFLSQQPNFYFYELIKNVLSGYYFSLVLFCTSS